MNNLETYNVKEINDLDLIALDGGGWLFDLGAAAHRFFHDMGDAWDSAVESGMTSGGYAGMGYH
jgi:hypothetical protein|tara:strand:- start:918 stop:1109 length:192 start_codon:yes stop_codon:yes gene_type:complete